MSQLHDASSEARFQAFVEELVGVIGHAGSCRTAAGLLHRGCCCRRERKSVEADGGDYSALSHRPRSTNRCCISSVKSPWSDETVLAKVAFVGNACNRKHRSDRSLDYRRHQLSKEGQAILSAWRANIPANSVSRTIVRSPSRYPSQTMRRAFRSPIVSICLRTGPMIRRAGRKSAFRKMSSSRPSRMIALDQITAACDAGLPQGVVLIGCRIWCRLRSCVPASPRSA